MFFFNQRKNQQWHHSCKAEKKENIVTGLTTLRYAKPYRKHLLKPRRSSFLTCLLFPISLPQSGLPRISLGLLLNYPELFSRAGISKLQPAALSFDFLKNVLLKLQPHPLNYILYMVAIALKWHSWVVATKTVCPISLNYWLSDPLRKLCHPLLWM